MPTDPKPYTLSPGCSVMAHVIVYKGVSHPLSVATLSSDGTLTIRPFTAETPATPFVNGKILILPES